MDNLLSGNQSTLKFKQWGNVINNVMLIAWRVYWEIHNDSGSKALVSFDIYKRHNNGFVLLQT
ncbi:hypothetical protein T01_10470 [Trichinella spiralis]|uniref:Uncharacterized protein n=1 Tax=Trichinella spiralis TaxID=6334 RepID=A0A0V1B0S1_TRISP|nr:hypothetical protein T01_10470 [Trichinella spiralis]